MWVGGGKGLQVNPGEKTWTVKHRYMCIYIYMYNQHVQSCIHVQYAP